MNRLEGPRGLSLVLLLGWDGSGVGGDGDGGTGEELCRALSREGVAGKSREQLLPDGFILPPEGSGDFVL